MPEGLRGRARIEAREPSAFQAEPQLLLAILDAALDLGFLAELFGLGAIFAIGWSPCIGIILGGRLGYALFYSPDFYLFKNPLEFFKLWEGGMSFHGGVIGTTLGILYLARKEKLSTTRTNTWAQFNVTNSDLVSVLVQVPRSLAPKHPSSSRE